jgi:hypothetical protein
MPNCQKPKDYCYIRATMFLPDDIDVLALDWSPAPPVPRLHFPNRVIAHRQGVRIAREELAFLRQRLDAIGEEIQAEQNLEQFRQEFDSLQARVRAALGVNEPPMLEPTGTRLPFRTTASAGSLPPTR